MANRSIGSVRLDLIVNAAKLRTGMQQAANETSKSSRAIAREIKQQTRQAKDSVDLLGDAVGIRLPRELKKLIAGSQLIGPALAAAFNLSAIAAGGVVLFELGKQIIDVTEKMGGLTDAVKKFEQAAVDASNKALISFKTIAQGQELLATQQANIAATEREMAKAFAANTTNLARIPLVGPGLAAAAEIANLIKRNGLIDKGKKLQEGEIGIIQRLGELADENNKKRDAANKKAAQDLKTFKSGVDSLVASLKGIGVTEDENRFAELAEKANAIAAALNDAKSKHLDASQVQGLNDALARVLTQMDILILKFNQPVKLPFQEQFKDLFKLLPGVEDFSKTAHERAEALQQEIRRTFAAIIAQEELLRLSGELTGESIASVENKIKQIKISGIAALRPVIQELKNLAKQLNDPILQQRVNELTADFERLGLTIPRAFSGVRPAFRDFIRFAEDAGPRIYAAISQALDGISRKLAELAVTGKATFAEVFKEFRVQITQAVFDKFLFAPILKAFGLSKPDGTKNNPLYTRNADSVGGGLDDLFGGKGDEESKDGPIGKVQEKMNKIFKSIGDAMAKVFKQIGEFFKTIVSAIGSVIKSLFSAIGGLFGGFRASGGPVDAGKIYRVNEFGPEFFKPEINGRIIPVGAGGSQPSMNPIQVFMTVNANDAGSFRQSSRQMSEDLAANISAAMRRK